MILCSSRWLRYATQQQRSYDVSLLPCCRPAAAAPAGQKDKGSGLRVYYTDVLRPHDIGLITLQQPVLNIPPGQAVLRSNVSVCPSECTAK